MDLSIIIVNRNTSKLLSNCLLSIQKSRPGLEVEIIVVDNGSSDDSVAMVHGNFPQVHLIGNRNNLGFAQANNQGLKISRGRYSLLLNSDTLVPEPALLKMLAYLDQHPEVGALGPQLRFPDGRIQPSCRAFPSLKLQLYESTGLSRIFPRSPIFGQYRMGYWSHDTVREVDQLMGAALMVRREVIEQVGLLDEQFFFYFDEVDWCYRIKKHGWKIIFYPEAFITHLSGQTSRKEWRKTILSRYVGMMKYFKKHFPASQQPFLRLLIQLELLLRIGLEVPFWLTRPGERHLRQDRIRGYWQVCSQGRLLNNHR